MTRIMISLIKKIHAYLHYVLDLKKAFAECSKYGRIKLAAVKKKKRK